MISKNAKQRFRATGCEIAFDNLTRQLYATDASLYQIEPVAVAFPRTAQEAARSFRRQRTRSFGHSTRRRDGLVGGALGDGLIVDFSRHNRQITGLGPGTPDRAGGAGVVLDQLNDFLNRTAFVSARTSRPARGRR